MMRLFWIKSLMIMWKDIISEFRTKDTIASVIVFSILVIIIFNFTFEPGSEVFKDISPSIIWVAFTFAGMLSFNRSFSRDKERGCLEGLVLCPVDRMVIYIGKMLACLTFMLVVEVIVLPVFCILYDLPLFLPKLILITILATIGFAAVGTIFSALSVHTRAREIMLPLLFLPVVVPVIIAAIKAFELVLEGEPWSELTSWLLVIVAFDVVFLVIATLVFEYVLEE